MSKVTSKLQVTIPKAVAEVLGVRPGDEVDWVVAGDGARLTPVKGVRGERDPVWRLATFDAATARQKKRDASRGSVRAVADRGWTREDLYRRGRAG